MDLEPPHPTKGGAGVTGLLLASEGVRPFLERSLAWGAIGWAAAQEEDRLVLAGHAGVFVVFLQKLKARIDLKLIKAHGCCARC